MHWSVNRIPAIDLYIGGSWKVVGIVQEPGHKLGQLLIEFSSIPDHLIDQSNLGTLFPNLFQLVRTPGVLDTLEPKLGGGGGGGGRVLNNQLGEG